MVRLLVVCYFYRVCVWSLLRSCVVRAMILLACAMVNTVWCDIGDLVLV